MDNSIEKNLNELKRAIELKRALEIADKNRVKFRDTKAKFDKDKVRAKNKSAKKARRKQRK